MKKNLNAGSVEIMFFYCEKKWKMQLSYQKSDNRQVFVLFVSNFKNNQKHSW